MNFLLHYFYISFGWSILSDLWRLHKIWLFSLWFRRWRFLNGVLPQILLWSCQRYYFTLLIVWGHEILLVILFSSSYLLRLRLFFAFYNIIFPDLRLLVFFWQRAFDVKTLIVLIFIILKTKLMKHKCNGPRPYSCETRNQV